MAAFVVDCRDTPDDAAGNLGRGAERRKSMWLPDEHGLLHRHDVLDSGVTQRELEAAIASGELVLVSRGVYLQESRISESSRYRGDVLYRARCLAVGAARPGEQPALLSHDSAAALHGLPVLLPTRTRVHRFAQRPHGGNAKERKTVFHTGTVPDEDIVEVDGVRVTGLARTVVDLALTGPFHRALAAFDAGLARGLDRDELAERLAVRRRGVGTARFALRHANPLADNPGESWCRAQVIEARLPIPALQVRYDLRDGSVAYVDLDFDGQVVVEFDGLTKYRQATIGSKHSPEEVVIREKLREDKLRELGLDMVRTVWQELRDASFIPVLTDHLGRRGLC